MPAPTKILALLLVMSLTRNAAELRAQQSGQESDRISFSGLFYLAYEQGEEGGADFGRFAITRGYLTAQARILPKLSARITFDPSQDMDGDGRGDMEVRLKYAYARYAVGDRGPFTGINLEGGIVHMVWLDFEERVNLYRMRDPMFMERSGMFNSADFGVTLAGGIGENLPEAYRRDVASAYAARHGSFSVGVYNGAGYHGDERNQDKVLQGRLTLRPLPEALPGLQLSGLVIAGKGNAEGPAAEIPDWRVYDALLSYQHSRGALTAQYAWGRGNQRGSWTEPGNAALATDYDGYSIFAEQRLGDRSAWRLVAGYDNLERRPGSLDRGFQRIHGGVGYDLGDENMLLLDLDRREWNDSALSVDTRFQVVMQVSF
jgi:hypothetical protein